MQSCTTDITDKSQVPGKLLAIKSLGFRETSNQVSVQEIDPYTVRVIKTLCKAELLSIEQQALIETKQGTQSFDCTDAYATYIAHNITAFGVPLLYDSFTGFNLLKERCRKREPVYRVVTREPDGTVKNEVYDDNTTVCEKLPVADILLTAKIDATPIYLATSADGTASLPPEKIAQLERASANALITYKYEAIELTTRHVNKKPATPSKYSIFATYSPADDYVSKANESHPTENSGEIALGKGFVAAVTPPAAGPVLLPNIAQSVTSPAPAAGKTAAAVMPAQASAAKDSSPKIIREAASAPKASRPLRDKRKGTASVPPKTLSPAKARSKAKSEPAAKETVHPQTLPIRPELNGVCCPLTEKLFWNIGK